jgi:hypothetical protein
MKSRITEKQITAALREVESEEANQELCAKQGDPKYSEARCAQLEEENRRLKLLVADLILRNEALKLMVSKKW